MIYTTRDETAARQMMVTRNRKQRIETYVMVDGPDDGEYTVMGMQDAIRLASVGREAMQVAAVALRPHVASLGARESNRVAAWREKVRCNAIQDPAPEQSRELWRGVVIGVVVVVFVAGLIAVTL